MGGGSHGAVARTKYFVMVWRGRRPARAGGNRWTGELCSAVHRVLYYLVLPLLALYWGYFARLVLAWLGLIIA